jgi:hypothetical protein
LEEDDREKHSGIPFDTCLQPKDLTEETATLLEFAPGEGKLPLPFTSDQLSEQLSFPQLFPKGNFGFSTTRPVKLSKADCCTLMVDLPKASNTLFMLNIAVRLRMCMTVSL